MDTNLENLLAKRDQFIKNIEEGINGWEGSVEEAVKIVEKNQTHFKNLESLDKELRAISHPSIYSKEYEDRLKDILQAQKELIGKIKAKKESLLHGMKQLKKKEKVINNYISQDKRSIFIDKDL